MTNVCPHCEAGTLSPTRSTEAINFEGTTLNVEMEFSVCDHCHEEIVTPAQAKANDVRFADAKRGASGLLTASEIKATLCVCDLSQADAARVFGGGVNAFSRYERGEVIQSKQMDLLLRVSRDVPVARAYFLDLAGISKGPWEEMPGVVVQMRPGRVPAAAARSTKKFDRIESAEAVDVDWQPVAAQAR
jgi:HTH-type transcriptional regulator/antitoxin MqsA